MLPDDDIIDWILDVSEDVLHALGGSKTWRETTVTATPTPEDFPVDARARGHELAEQYLDFVIAFAGLDDEWSFELTEEVSWSPVDALGGAPHDGGPVFTDSLAVEPADSGDDSDEPLVIVYSPAMLEDPTWLVAWLANSVAHYVVNDSRPDAKPAFAELGAVYLGFGIFLANASYRVSPLRLDGRGTVGGQTFHLSQVALCYSLAVVTELLAVPDAEILPHLSPNAVSYVTAARRDLRGHSKRLEQLSSVASKTSRGPYR